MLTQSQQVHRPARGTSSTASYNRRKTVLNSGQFVPRARAAWIAEGIRFLMPAMLFLVSTQVLLGESQQEIGSGSPDGARATTDSSEVVPRATADHMPQQTQQTEGHAPLNALCGGVLLPHMERIAADPFSVDPRKPVPAWMVRQKGIWFIEDAGGPDAEKALERIGTSASPEAMRAAAEFFNGKLMSYEGANVLEVQAEALAALWRLNPAKGREAIAKAIAQGTLVFYDPFLPADRLPPPYIFTPIFTGLGPEDVQYFRQQTFIATPELTAHAKKDALAWGYASNGAWEYLRLTSTDVAGSTIRELLKVRSSDRLKVTDNYAGGTIPWEYWRAYGLAYQRYYQFEMLREAVRDGLFDEEYLVSLAKDNVDDDRAFWGAYGLARKGNPDALDLLVEQARSAPRQWKYLALAALAITGDEDAADTLVETALEGTIVQRTYEAHAIAAIYDYTLDENAKAVLRDIIEVLASDAAFIVNRYTLDRSYWLPPAFAVDLVISNEFRSRYIRGTWGDTPTDLAPLLGIAETDSRLICKYYSDTRADPIGNLMRTGRHCLPELRKMLLTRSAADGDSLGQSWFYTLDLGSQSPSQGWQSAMHGTPQDRAYGLGVLAYLGDAEAAEELCEMIDKGLDVPAEIAVQVRYPCMLPHLSRIVTRLARDDPKSPVLLEAARSYMAAMRKHAAQTGATVESTAAK